MAASVISFKCSSWLLFPEKVSVFDDLELIDTSENIENFKFTKISEEDLNDIKKAFLEEKNIFEFRSNEGNILLHTKYFRGLMYVDFSETNKTTIQENREAAVEISTLNHLKKERKNGGS